MWGQRDEAAQLERDRMFGMTKWRKFLLQMREEDIDRKSRDEKDRAADQIWKITSLATILNDLKARGFNFPWEQIPLMIAADEKSQKHIADTRAGKFLMEYNKS